MKTRREFPGSELAAIHQQIKEFPDSDTNSDFMEAGAPTGDAVRQATTRRENKMKQTDVDIEQLETDIADLEKKIRQQKQQNTVGEAWQKYHTHSQPDNTNKDILLAQLEGLKYQIDQLGEITEVKLVDTKTDITEQGTLWCKKTKHVEGYCGPVEFTLDISLQETMKEDMTVNSRITDLSIATSNNILHDLGDTVERLATEGNAQGFLALLPPYSQWLTARETTFQHFVTKYPKVATRKSGAELHLNHPTKKVTIIVQWKFKVTDICSVVPDLHLDIQVPKKVSPPNNVLQTAPETFQLMLKEIGIEKAIHSLVLLLQE